MKLGVDSVFIVSLFACTLFASIAWADVSADTIERAEKSVVRIEVHSDEGDSLGSGFVVSSDGIIITNSHVISGAKTAVAHFANGYKLDILATRLIDPSRDIAIAKIDGIGLPVIPLASDNPRKGEAVMALGSPLGLSFTATRGIVSAIRTSVEMSRELGDKDIKGTWIQVDAALSPGNSGGPLINESGQVVAMSTLASGGGNAQNLNFGICVKDIQEAFVNTSNRPWVPLASGAAKAIHPSRSKGRSHDGGLETPEIPANAIRTYIDDTRSDLKTYIRNMAQELTKIKNDHKEMKAGSTSLPPEIRVKPNVEIAIERTGRAKTTKRYYFRSEKVKNREVGRLDNLIRRLTSDIEKSKGSDSEAALMAVLEHSGPVVEPRRKGSIGLMKDAMAIAAIGENGVVIEYDSQPYVLVVDSATGIFPGQEIEPMPVFVGGIIPTSESLGGANLTVLVEVPDRSIKAQLSPSSQKEKTAPTDSPLKSEVEELLGNSASPKNAPSDGSREWNDRTGRFSVQAKLISSDGNEVVLKKSDGKILKIPRNKLSDADQRYLDQK